MTPSFHIRPAGPADADALGHLAESVAAQPLLVRYGVTPSGLSADLRRLALSLPDPASADAPHSPSRLVLAEEIPATGPPEPRGFARFQVTGTLGPGAYLQLIAMHPGAEGRGLGSALLQAVESESARTSPALFLLTAEFNTGAQRFYERHGYTLAGRLPDYVRPGLTELLYFKRFTAQPASSPPRMTAETDR